MSFEFTWRSEFEAEINQALRARENGNEGMARVSARRAVGILLGEYLTRQGYENPSNSAYDRLTRFTSLPEIDEQVKATCGDFLLKVDSDRNLPPDIDLIAEAQWLCKRIFPDLS